MSFIYFIIAIALTTAISFLASSNLNQLNIESDNLVPLVSAISGALTLLLFHLLKSSPKFFKRPRRASKLLNSPRQLGTIKWFNTKKQYGFITTDNGDDIFIHKRFIEGDKRQKIREGMRVEFSISETDKGLQAEQVKIIE